MDNIAVFASIGTPVLQSLLMGMIGYPLSKVLPGGIEAFRRSGFTWWLITLVLLFVAAVIWVPQYLKLVSPSLNDITFFRVGLTLVAGLAALAALELLAAEIDRRLPSIKAQAARERYYEALPRWASSLWMIVALLALTAFLEEAAYRGVGLSGLVLGLGLSKPLGAGIIAVAFGLAHWYFGARQILLKMADGTVFCAIAFSSGWLAAAVAHVLFNVGLVIIGTLRER